MEQRGLFHDEWLMILAGACTLCAVLSAMNHDVPGRYFPAPGSRSQAAAPAAPTAAPVAPAAAPAQAAPAAEAPYASAAPAAPRALTARTPGRWIVDQRGAPDADTAFLSEAVANSKPGDTILVRPGTYAEHLVLTQSLTLKGESAVAPPTILGTGATTIAISAAEVTLENLTIAHKPNPGDQMQPALFVKNGTLLARKLEIEEMDPTGAANDACLVLTHSKLDFKEGSVSGCAMGLVGGQESTFTVSGSRFANVGKIGVSALTKSDGKIDHTTFARMYSGIAVSQGASVKATNVVIADGNRGVEAGPDSTAVLEDVEITDQKSAAVLIDSAIVRVERARLTRDGYGFAVSHKAILTVSGTKIIDSLKEPYHWTKAEDVQFSGGGNDPEPAN